MLSLLTSSTATWFGSLLKNAFRAGVVLLCIFCGMRGNYCVILYTWTTIGTMNLCSLGKCLHLAVGCCIGSALRSLSCNDHRVKLVSCGGWFIMACSWFILQLTVFRSFEAQLCWICLRYQWTWKSTTVGTHYRRWRHLLSLCLLSSSSRSQTFKSEHHHRLVDEEFSGGVQTSFF